MFLTNSVICDIVLASKCFLPEGNFFVPFNCPKAEEMLTVLAELDSNNSGIRA